MFLFSEFYKFMVGLDRQSILLSPNFPGPHEFHNFMGKVRIQQNTFFSEFHKFILFLCFGWRVGNVTSLSFQKL